MTSYVVVQLRNHWTVCLFGTKPLPVTMMPYCQRDPFGNDVGKISTFSFGPQCINVWKNEWSQCAKSQFAQCAVFMSKYRTSLPVNVKRIDPGKFRWLIARGFPTNLRNVSGTWYCNYLTSREIYAQLCCTFVIVKWSVLSRSTWQRWLATGEAYYVLLRYIGDICRTGTFSTIQLYAKKFCLIVTENDLIYFDNAAVIIVISPCLQCQLRYQQMHVK